MSNIDTQVSYTEVIPVLESDLFVGHEEKQFAMGILAIGDETLNERDAELLAYYRLRKKVYYDQTQMISEHEIQGDTDVNPDDIRSVHMGMFENYAPGIIRSTGAIKLIIKSEQHNAPLPIEDFFPEAFADAVPMRGIEVSRFIARHEIAKVQNGINSHLLTGALSYIISHDLGPTYGVVEPKVQAQLTAQGVPIRAITDPKYVEKYSADNLGIEVNTGLMARMTERAKPGTLQKLREAEGTFAYFDIARGSVSNGSAA